MCGIPFSNINTNDMSTFHLLLRIKIERQISEVDSGILSEVLYQKYIFGKTLEDIGAILNYSTRHIERLHIKALDLFKM